MPVSLARPLVAAQSSRGNGASDWHPGALVAENDPELLRLIVEADGTCSISGRSSRR